MEDRRPSSMADVAERAGVSVATVSRALRGSPLVSAETTERVVQAANDLSFAISRAASSLATGKLDRVAVLVSGSLGSWFNGCLLDTVYQTLHDRGQELLIYRTLSTGERDEFFATLPARRNADALIVASLELAAGQRQRLHELGLPLVFVNQRLAGAASVSIDDAAGAAVATQHLINLGHRRIAYVGLRHEPGVRVSSAARLAGYRQAMKAAKVPARDQLLITTPRPADGEDVVGQLLSASSTPHRPAGRVRRSGHARAGRRVADGTADAAGPVGGRVRRSRDGVGLRADHHGAARRAARSAGRRTRVGAGLRRDAEAQDDHGADHPGAAGHDRAAAGETEPTP